jgi:hypothetical protein
MEDGYMGSGVALKRAMSKYGRENFKKEVIKFFNSEEEAYLYEKEIVNEDLIKNNLCYNITLGGIGGFSHIDNRGTNNPMYGKNELQKEIQGRPEVRRKKSVSTTNSFLKKYADGYISPIKGTHNYWDDKMKAETAKIKMSQNHSDVRGINNTFYGQKHSEESLKKMSFSHKNREKVECPHCSKIGDISNMSRWHLNNCKMRK